MHARWLSRLLLPRMKLLATRRPPDFEVIRGDNNDTYLRRWWLIPRNNWFNIYLHNMILDDDATLHDHPYWSLSLVLTDGLDENYVKRPDKIWSNQDLYKIVDGRFVMEYAAQSRRISAGDLVWRGKHFAHQLIVRHDAWTIFITGPRVKAWGFWCPRGFRKWDQYVSVTQDPSGKMQGGQSKMGIGCGEQS